MGIFSFFKKKKEIEEEIKISEEEKLLSDLQKAITLLKEVILPGRVESPGSLHASFQEARKLLEHIKEEIKLIESIAKKQVKESLKPGTYRRASLDHDLKTAHETLEEAKAELTEIINYLKKPLHADNVSYYGWNLVTGQFPHHPMNPNINNKRWQMKRNETLAEFNKRISYLETLEKNIIYLIDLEKKAKEQS